MMRQVCSPRIGCRFFVPFALVLLSSTFAFAHNPQTSDLADNPAVAAQLQSGQGKPAQLDGERVFRWLLGLGLAPLAHGDDALDDGERGDVWVWLAGLA